MIPESTRPSDLSSGEAGDWIIRQFITAADLQRSPEEYVARNAHLWEAFSFHLYQFQDPLLGAWVGKVGQLLGSPCEVERCREHWLTADERATARRHDQEEF